MVTHSVPSLSSTNPNLSLPLSVLLQANEGNGWKTTYFWNAKGRKDKIQKQGAFLTCSFSMNAIKAVLSTSTGWPVLTLSTLLLIITLVIVATFSHNFSKFDVIDATFSHIKTLQNSTLETPPLERIRGPVNQISDNALFCKNFFCTDGTNGCLFKYPSLMTPFHWEPGPDLS